MLEIKKQHNSAKVTAQVLGIDYMEDTISNMVQYVKDIKALNASGYDDFEFDDVVEWLSDTDDNLLIEDMERFSQFVYDVGKNHYDGYYVKEYLYMFAETQNRISADEE